MKDVLVRKRAHRMQTAGQGGRGGEEERTSKRERECERRGKDLLALVASGTFGTSGGPTNSPWMAPK